MKKLFRSNPSGQSLLEVVVALGVVLFVLASVVAVVVINIFGQKVSENKVIASNLARESIEIFRNIRDSGTLSRRTPTEVTSNTYLESVHCYTPVSLQANNTWTLAAVANDFDSDTQVSVFNNVYQYSVDPSAIETPFKRRIIIDPVCASSSECSNGICEATAQTCNNNEGACTSIKGYRLRSQVRWNENGQAQTFEIVDFIYNWH